MTKHLLQRRLVAFVAQSQRRLVAFVGGIQIWRKRRPVARRVSEYQV